MPGQKRPITMPAIAFAFVLTFVPQPKLKAETIPDKVTFSKLQGIFDRHRVNSHGPEKFYMNSGFNRVSRPSTDAWINYGMSSESSNLPGFLVLQSGLSEPRAVAPNWGSGFLPSTFQGLPFREKGAPILNLDNPAGVDSEHQRRFVDGEILHKLIA
jgi:hypothetical protein